MPLLWSRADCARKSREGGREGKWGAVGRLRADAAAGRHQRRQQLSQIEDK